MRNDDNAIRRQTARQIDDREKKAARFAMTCEQHGQQKGQSSFRTVPTDSRPLPPWTPVTLQQ